MIKCPSCNAHHAEGVRCSKCLASYCFCANITEKIYQKLGKARQASLFSAGCKSANNKQAASDQIGPAAAATLDQVLQELRNGIAEINVRLEQLPSLVQEVKDIRHNLRSFEDTMSSLKTDVKEMKTRVEKVEVEVKLREQRERANNVEIKGVPLKRNENLFEIVSRLGDVLGQPVSAADINFVTRARSTTTVKPMIVGFLGRYKKENFVAAATSHKSTKASDIGLTGAGAESKVYVKYHLTPSNKKLLSSTNSLALEKGFKYTWVQNSRILTRKNDTSPIVVIRSEDGLSKIK